MKLARDKVILDVIAMSQSNLMVSYLSAKGPFIHPGGAPLSLYDFCLTSPFYSKSPTLRQHRCVQRFSKRHGWELRRRGDWLHFMGSMFPHHRLGGRMMLSFQRGSTRTGHSLFASIALDPSSIAAANHLRMIDPTKHCPGSVWWQEYAPE